MTSLLNNIIGDVIIAIKGYKRGSIDQYFHTHSNYQMIHVKVVT